MAAAANSSCGENNIHDNIYRPKKSQNSKRIIAARAFLKSITFDGRPCKEKPSLSSKKEQNEHGKKDRPKLPQISFDEDELLSSLPTTARVQLHHSLSVACAGNVEDDLNSQRSGNLYKISEEQFNNKTVDESVKVSKSKSFIIPSPDALLERRSLLKESSKINLIEPRFFIGRTMRNLFDRRTVLVSRNSIPFRLMSVMPYRKGRELSKEKKATAQHQTNNTIFIEGVEKAEGENVVSYSHMLVPAAFSKRTNPDSHEGADDSMPSSARDDQSSEFSYDPLILDDPGLTSGKHKTVLNLKSFRVSIIQYAKPSEIKKDINERFKEKFPNTHITLTKLRSIKADMLEIGVKCCLEKATIACGHVYFEKLVIKEKINKVNRKYCAGACLILAAKFMEDIKKGSMSIILETIVDKFRLHLRDLLSCELLVLIALDFSLCLPTEEVSPLYRRLEGTRLLSPNTPSHLTT